MNIKLRGLILVTLMLAVLGTACLFRSEGPSNQGELNIVGEGRTGEPSEPSGPSSPPITIIDNIDPNECSFVHNINACFSDGQPPAGISLGDYTGVYFRAKQELSDRTGEDHFGAKIKSVQRVQWNDSSLGNAKAGSYYLQVITPGFRLVLESGGALHTYHTSLDRVVFVGSN